MPLLFLLFSEHKILLSPQIKSIFLILKNPSALYRPGSGDPRVPGLFPEPPRVSLLLPVLLPGPAKRGGGLQVETRNETLDFRILYNFKKILLGKRRPLLQPRRCIRTRGRLGGGGAEPPTPTHPATRRKTTCPTGGAPPARRYSRRYVSRKKNQA